MDLFYCGEQWGYTPVGRVLNIPVGYCNDPLNLSRTYINQFVTFSWDAPHDYLHFLLEYKRVIDPTWTSVQVSGTNYLVALQGLTEYEWRVTTVCEIGRTSLAVIGANVTTGRFIASCSPVSSVTVINAFDQGWKVEWASSGAAYYEITVWPDSDKSLPILNDKTSSLEYYIPSNLAKGDYKVAVKAYCFDGTFTMLSPFAYFSVSGITCPAPKSLTYSATYNSILIAWFPPNAVPGLLTDFIYSYNVYLNGDLIVKNYPDTSFAFIGLTSNTLYSIEVRTNCGDIAYSQSTTLSVTTPLPVCNEPTLLVPTSLTGTGFTLNWVPGAGIVSQELIINNGTPIPLAANITTYVLSGLTSGSNVSVRVKSVCSGIKSVGIQFTVLLSGCGAVTGLSVITNSGGIYATWNPVANALYYLVSISKDGAPADSFQHNSTSYHFANPLLGSTYAITVTSVCIVAGAPASGDPVAESEVTITADPYGNCTRYAINDIKYVNATTVGFTIAEIPNNPYGNSIRLVAYASGDLLTVINTKVVNTPAYYELGNLIASSSYDLYAYSIINPYPNESDPSLDGCTRNNPTAYDHNSCWQPLSSNISVAWVGADTISLNVTGAGWTGSQTEFELFIQKEDAPWVSLGTVLISALPYVTASIPRQPHRFKLIAKCAGIPLNEVISKWACPDTPLMNFIINGSVLNIRESEGITNVTVGPNTMYDVTVNSISRGSFNLSLPRDGMIINNLYPNTVYSVEVRSICPNDPVGYGTIRVFSFITSSNVESSCPIGTFNAIIQSCVFDNPPDENPPTPVATNCVLIDNEWILTNYLFIRDPQNLQETTYYFEAILQLEVSGQINTEFILPGGTAAFITTAACRPVASTILNTEIISGIANIVSLGAVLTNDGNLVISGTYESNGSPFISIRVRGTYNYL